MMETTTQARESEVGVETPSHVDEVCCWICNRNEIEVRKFLLTGFLSGARKANLKTPLASLARSLENDVGKMIQPVVFLFEKVKIEVPVCLICRNIGYNLSVLGVTWDLENLEEQSDLKKAVAGHIAFALSGVITELRELEKKLGLSP